MKLTGSSKRHDVDSIITFTVLKKLVTPISKTQAYKLKLVDDNGKLLREPKNKTEENSLTMLDRIIFVIKKLLGTRLASLYNFVYLQTSNIDLYNNLVSQGSPSQKAEITRIRKQLKMLKEESSINNFELINILLEDDQYAD